MSWVPRTSPDRGIKGVRGGRSGFPPGTHNRRMFLLGETNKFPGQKDPVSSEKGYNQDTELYSTWYWVSVDQYRIKKGFSITNKNFSFLPRSLQSKTRSPPLRRLRWTKRKRWLSFVERGRSPVFFPYRPSFSATRASDKGSSLTNSRPSQRAVFSRTYI